MGIGTAIGVGSIAAGTIGATGSIVAAGTQADASKSAAQLQAQEAQNSLDFQKQQWNTQQANQAPWLKAGQQAIGQLSDLVSNGGFPDWNQQFQAPTAATEQNDPGYQFRLQQGKDALDNSATARGGVLSGNTAKALEDYTQNYASNEYSNVYGRALGEYQQNYNIYETNQANKYNRLASLSGAGQVAAGQLGQEGQAAAGNVTNIGVAAGGQIGQSLQNAGAATASGYVGAGNAASGAISNLSQLALLQNSGLLGSGGPPPGYWGEGVGG